VERRGDRLSAVAARFAPTVERRLTRDRDRLNALARALATLDPGRPKPGFARVENPEGAWITSAATLQAGQAVRLVFGDGARDATIDGGEGLARPAPPVPAKPAPKVRPPAPGQGDLF